jgi:hypothetical protein
MGELEVGDVPRGGEDISCASVVGRAQEDVQVLGAALYTRMDGHRISAADEHRYAGCVERL